MPIIPHGSTQINRLVAVFNDRSHWTYSLGCHPIYRHRSGDQNAFRLTIAQLASSGAARPVEIINAFGISKSCMMRVQRQYRERGMESFFKPPAASPGRRLGRVLTPEVLQQAQQGLDQGLSKALIAQELDIPLDTLRRAVWDGRLTQADVAGEDGPRAGSDKSQRGVRDAQAAEGMGTGCTRPAERVLAALGALDGAAVRFEPCRHLPYGGVLCALGALLINGLLSPARESLNKISGYYDAVHVLLLLAFMSLCRIKTLEQLRSKAPGEFGKLMGLDRVPEVRCLRAKLQEMSRGEAAEKWAAALARQWMEEEPEALGTLYVDGHVRVYHGSKTKLPRKYVSRQRLCLRGCTDYWVNDRIGRPFFVIDKVVDQGLLATLREDIVPRLLGDLPAQPTPQELAARPHLCRLILVFDREGYSPGFFQEMWREHRIGCLTYHKHPKGQWPEQEFVPHQIELGQGETLGVKLAERGTLVGGKGNAIWMKEVRKLSPNGHQVSLIGTAYELEAGDQAGRLMSRWCQENFFRYMMQHFGIDLLVEYDTEPLHDTQKVINPQWRALERERGSLESKLRYRRARFAKLTLHTVDARRTRTYQTQERIKAELHEEIGQLELRLAAVKEARKNTARYIAWEELPENERFTRPVMGSKRLMDTVRMIGYRAETAMCGLLRSPTVDNAAARRLLQDLFVSEADLFPDVANGRLEVHVHRGSRPAVDRHLTRLFEQLNEMAITFPGTELTMNYRLVGSLPTEAPQTP